MKTCDLTEYLDDYLEIKKIPDSSQNGLQVEGKSEVESIGVAVDACLDSIQAAAEAGVDLLIVHHGLFWERVEKLVGSHYQRVKALLEGEINLYCAHLPLDAHLEVGNNAVLARKLGFRPISGFGPADSGPVSIGCLAAIDSPISQVELFDRLVSNLGDEFRADFFGPSSIQSLAVLTGGGASFIPLAHSRRVDAYLTGEPKHSFYHFSKENNVNVIYGGHYETETFGVIALGEHLQRIHDLPFQFFHFPTGL